MKTPPQKKENKSRLQHGLEEGETESGKSMMPPTFQLLASPADEDEGSPKQMKWNGFGGSIEADGYGINDRNRNTNFFKPKGSVPKKEKNETDTGLGINGADWNKSSKNPGYDNGNGLKMLNA
ncbi:MAG TPA: hypothetical protein VHS96_10005, partial [Bacteroidia bacterium]|nr:hypothetical protein [Bacteroidia bacterium]